MNKIVSLIPGVNIGISLLSVLQYKMNKGRVLDQLYVLDCVDRMTPTEEEFYKNNKSIFYPLSYLFKLAKFRKLTYDKDGEKYTFYIYNDEKTGNSSVIKTEDKATNLTPKQQQDMFIEMLKDLKTIKEKNDDKLGEQNSITKQKESWSFYRDKYDFVNSKNSITQIFAQTTFFFEINGNRYESDEEIKITNIKSKRKTQLKKIIRNNYRGIISNKKEEAIALYDNFDKLLMSSISKLKKEYLVKDTVYYLDKKFISIYLRQNNLQVSFYNKIIKYDMENRLEIRKGYDNSNLKYCMNIENNSDINYAINIINEYYQNKESNEENIVYKRLILLLNTYSMNYNVINKGIVYKRKRNFAMVSKRKYGAVIKILDIQDDSVFTKIETKYDPLCYSYKVCNESDIKKIIPFIEMSYDLSEYNSFDIKHNLITV